MVCNRRDWKKDWSLSWRPTTYLLVENWVPKIGLLLPSIFSIPKLARLSFFYRILPYQCHCDKRPGFPSDLLDDGWCLMSTAAVQTTTIQL